MCVEPCGPNYEMSMTAQVLRPQPAPTVNALLSNRHSLGFGGLPLGQSTYVLSRMLTSADAVLHLVYLLNGV